jgi:SAM-dependent methyltransferase
MKHPQWQTTFINGYLTSLSNAARKRVAKEGKHPFINNLTTEEWNGFLNKNRIDYSEKMISSAVKSNKNIVFTKGDITKLKSYNNFEKFDFIFTNRCLINIFSKKKINFIIDNIYKISKKNGIILFMEIFP